MVGEKENGSKQKEAKEAVECLRIQDWWRGGNNGIMGNLENLKLLIILFIPFQSL